MNLVGEDQKSEDDDDDDDDDDEEDDSKVDKTETTSYALINPYLYSFDPDSSLTLLVYPEPYF